MSPSVARGVQNLRRLKINYCNLLEEVIIEEEQQGEEIMTNEPLFLLLEELELEGLPKLGHFILTKCALEFPFLRKVNIVSCLEMKTFVQQGSVSTLSIESVNNDDEAKEVDLNKVMFNSKVSCPSLEELSIEKANSISTLFSHQLPTAYLSKLGKLEVDSCRKLRNLMSPSVARGLLNLSELKIENCESMEEVITEEERGEEIKTTQSLFPLLESLKLLSLPKLGHFFLTKHALKFQFPREVKIDDCPEMKTFVQHGISMNTPSLKSVNNDDEMKVVDLNKVMFNSKANFSKLEMLYVSNCGKLINLMFPSVARGASNLRILDIKDCQSMEEVITKEEQQAEGIMTLFPHLEKLELRRLPMLGHFFLTECALEIPLLRQVTIDECPEMKTFVQQEVSVSTPSLKLLNNGYMVKVDDLNIWTQQRFNPKDQSEASDGDESEANDGDKSEVTDGDKSEATDGDKSEVTDGDKSEASDDYESEATDGDKSEASDNHESEATDGNESEATNGDESEATKSQKGEP